MAHVTCIVAVATREMPAILGATTSRPLSPSPPQRALAEAAIIHPTAATSPFDAIYIHRLRFFAFSPVLYFDKQQSMTFERPQLRRAGHSSR